MKKNLRVFSVVIIVIVSIVLFWQLLDQINPIQSYATVDYSTTYSTVATIFQRKTFFANGRFWLFYSNGTNEFYTTSINGVDWQTPAFIASGISSSAMSVWYDNGVVHYANAGGAGSQVLYRKGQIVGNEIEWSNEQVVAGVQPGIEQYNAYCTVDSQGFPWVSFMWNIQNEWTVEVSRANSVNADSWALPTQITNTSSLPMRPCLLPLPNGNIYAVFASENGIKGRLWDKTRWEQAEEITDKTPFRDFGYSAVILNGEVHLAFLENSTKNVYYFRRASDGVWNEQLVEGNPDIVSPPVLSADQSTNRLYCMWLEGKTLQVRTTEKGSWTKMAVGDLGLTFPEGLSTFYDCSQAQIGVALLDSLSQHVENYRLSYVVIKKP